MLTRSKRRGVGRGGRSSGKGRSGRGRDTYLGVVGVVELLQHEGILADLCHDRLGLRHRAAHALGRGGEHEFSSERLEGGGEGGRAARRDRQRHGNLEKIINHNNEIYY